LKEITIGRHVIEFVDRINGGAFDQNAVGIGLEEDGSLIAGVKFDNWNYASICMHVAAIPTKRWMTREYLWFCFYYPFIQLKARKIIGFVAESNLEARRFDEHLGFRLEHSIADAHPSGCLLIYSMTKDQCRFLERRHGIKE